jgi:phage repressor protein C with HTH and peptisase S24 domain
MTQAGAGRSFTEDGCRPAGRAGRGRFSDFPSDKVFALEVQGDSMEPLYRDGDVLIVSPSAGVRKGDSVVVRTNDGEVTAKELKRKTAKSLELRSLNPAHPDRVIAASDIAWVARVMWARQ